MKTTIIFIILLLSNIVSFSQGKDPCKPPGDPDGRPGCPDPTEPCVPLPPGMSIPVLRAVDPNEVIGPTGYLQIIGNDSIKWVSGKQLLPYKILFENSPKFATAPAQNIRIELPIHPKLNPASFRVGDFGFANMEFTVPPNSAIYTRRLDVRDSLHVFVDVTAGIDVVNRKAFWVFQAIDPATGLSTTVPASLGVLPVNDTLSRRGEGFVTLTLRPVSAVATRDSITAQASIIFDTEETIVTNKWLNIVDAVAPTSNISTVSAIDGNTARVNWTSQDDANGVGIDFYDLYVSQDNGAFQLYETRISALTYDFKGSSGSSYKFFTLATDLVGNKEALKSAGSNNIFLGLAPPIITASRDTACATQSITLTATNCAGTVTWSNAQTGNSINVTITTDTEYTANCTSGSNASNESIPKKIIFGGAIPTAALLGTQTINAGQSANLNLTFTGNNPWRFVINSQTYNNITSSSYQLSVNPSTTTVYTLTSVGNACGNFNVSTNNTATVTVIGTVVNTISTSALTGSPFCVGATVNVPFTATGTFTSGNIFTAQLSDATGSFASGTSNIGTISSTATSGTIAATIPNNAAAGTAYRIRVISSNPVINGTDNGTNLIIRAKATAALSGSQTITSGQTAILSATLSGTSPWSIIINGQTYSNITTTPYSIALTPTITTTYTLSSVTDVCGTVAISTNNTAIVTVSVDANCIPQIAWDKTLGGSDGDQVYSIIATSDGGYLVGGSSASNISGDKTENSKGDFDYWLVKLNANGQKEWDKTIGGSGGDWLQKITATTDGYVLAGYSNSPLSGDKTAASKGGYDFWLVKINFSGVKQWDKTLGGADGEFVSDIIPTSDNGFLIGGSSDSGISGDKSEANKGQSDFWVVKTNNLGVKQWDKAVGGSGNDYLNAMLIENDGSIVLAGSSRSGISGDKSEALNGSSSDPFETDYWVVKLSNTQIKQWDKSYGGSQPDYLNAIVKTNDGGYLIGGESSSPISSSKSESSKGSYDFWILKLNNTGQKQWDKTIGGNSTDKLTSMISQSDGAFILLGSSSSFISGDKTENSKGQNDFWAVKINGTGSKIWDKTIGGANDDGGFSKVVSSKIFDNNIIVAGLSQSGISGDKTEASRGGVDYWVVKLQENCCVNKPDLIVSDVTITKYTPNRIYYTAQIKNTGLSSVSMGSFFLGVYTSSDNLLNANDVWKYSITTGGGTLAPNQILSFSYNSSFSFTDNQYYLRLKADELGLISECDENNNNLFKLVNKCSTTGNLSITGNISAGYYATNQAVTISNAALSNNVLVVGKSISGNPSLIALNSVFMIGGCLNEPAPLAASPVLIQPTKEKNMLEFLESDSDQTVDYILSKDIISTIYIWNATTKTKVATIQDSVKSNKGLNSISLASYNLNSSDTYILNIETAEGIFAKAIE